MQSYQRNQFNGPSEKVSGLIMKPILFYHDQISKAIKSADPDSLRTVCPFLIGMFAEMYNDNPRVDLHVSELREILDQRRVELNRKTPLLC